MKPTKITLVTNTPNDSLTKILEDGTTQDQTGLCKLVSPELLQGTFDDVVQYLLDPGADEHNSDYSPDECGLADYIATELTTPQTLHLIPKRDGQFDSGYRISLTDRVSQHYASVVHTDTQDSDYKAIAVQLLATLDGGRK
ncbi:MAG: hypothetical protein ACI8Y7_000095 [Candidatus Woesearchaeota archaeon]|jgi:hypothetical protein